jgi:hypothetical protein
MGINAIPNARLMSQLALLTTVRGSAASTPISALTVPAVTGVDGEELCLLAAEVGYRATLQWTGDGRTGTMSAVLMRADVPGIGTFPSELPIAADLRQLANTPVSVGSGESLTNELRIHLSSRLPEYMVPSAFMVLSTLPLTPNGKINRRALPTPAQRTGSAQREPIAPRNDKEHKLAAIWTEVLGLATVGVHDDFFELGGDSLLSFRITNRANQAGLYVTPRHFFQHRTIAGLVQALEAEGPVTGPTAAARQLISRVARDGFRRKSTESTPDAS